MKESTKRPVTMVELDAIVNAEEKDIKKLLWKSYAYTGARLTELLEIKRRDIVKDTKSGRYFIVLNCRKSASSGIMSRVVSLPYELALELIQFAGTELGPIFPISERTVESWFSDVCKKLRIRGVTVHSLRHTFATYIFPPKTIHTIAAFKAVMGHKTAGGIQIYDNRPRYIHDRFRNPVEDLIGSGEKPRFTPSNPKGGDSR